MDLPKTTKRHFLAQLVSERQTSLNGGGVPVSADTAMRLREEINLLMEISKDLDQPPPEATRPGYIQVPRGMLFGAMLTIEAHAACVADGNKKRFDVLMRQAKDIEGVL